MMLEEKSVWAASTHMKARTSRPDKDIQLSYIHATKAHERCHVYNTNVPALGSKCVWQLKCILQVMLYILRVSLGDCAPCN